jgi:hypothetical protein
VSSAFFVLLALHRALTLGWRRSRGAVLALALGGSFAILPWTARNYFFLDEPILIETFAFENLWYSNTFSKPAFKEQQRRDIVLQPTLREQREAALRWTWRNLRRNPDKILPKIGDNLKHLLRPDGLHRFASVRATVVGWRHLVTILFEDIPWFVGWLWLLAFLLWSRRGPARLLLLLWLGYALLMLVVIFQNEVRYRSILAPFLLAAAASAWRRGPRWGRVLALSFSALLIGSLGTGRLVWDAAELALGMPREDAEGQRESAIANGFAAIRGGRLEQALREVGEIRQSGEDVRGPMARAWLNRELGNPDSAAEAAAEFHAAEVDIDATLLQEAAWHMLPAPGADRIEVGGLDVGAVLGFSEPLPRPSGDGPGANSAGPEPEAPHRWTRRRSWIRMRPSWAGTARLILRMGAPPPYQGEAPTVRVTAGDASGKFRLSAGMKEYSLDVRIGPPDLRIRIDSPTWNRSYQPSDQGVRVEWARVEPR